jgi:hypothetical protein
LSPILIAFYILPEVSARGFIEKKNTDVGGPEIGSNSIRFRSGISEGKAM